MANRYKQTLFHNVRQLLKENALISIHISLSKDIHAIGVVAQCKLSAPDAATVLDEFLRLSAQYKLLVFLQRSMLYFGYFSTLHRVV